ncbi:MAG: hypothetical protein ABL907_03570, partial [Hyphomicrobium sp.]
MSISRSESKQAGVFGRSGHICLLQPAGVCIPFVDPGLSALDAPVCWLPDTGAPTLTAMSSHAPGAADADLALDRLPSVQHIVGVTDRIQRLLVHATGCGLALDLHGDTVTSGPVNLTFQVHRLSRVAAVAALLAKLPSLLFDDPRRRIISARRTLLRDALVAFDGRLAGASYRDMAVVARHTLAGWPIYAQWKLFAWWLTFDGQAPDVFGRAGTVAALGG